MNEENIILIGAEQLAALRDLADWSGDDHSEGRLLHAIVTALESNPKLTLERVDG